MGDIGETYDPPVHSLRRSELFARPRATSTREDTLRKRIERDQAALAKIEERRERFGSEPEVGSTIVFVKKFDKPSPVDGRSRYPYAALRTGNGWYLTGRETKPKIWDDLIEFIGEGEFRVIAPPEEFAEWVSPLADFTAWAKRVAGLRLAVDPTTSEGVVLVFDDEGSALVSVDPAAPARKRHPLAPFEARRRDNVWEVVEWSEVHSDAYDVVKTFGGGSAQFRAEQSAAARNAEARREILSLLGEPPVGARVRSKQGKERWALRKPDGWTRFNGTVIQAVRLSWTSVRHQLGAIEPGSPFTDEMFSDD